MPAVIPPGGFNAFAQQFVERVFLLRRIGLAAGFFCVAGVFYANQAHPLHWLALVMNGFAWPYIARRIALHAESPRQGEVRNLLVDSAMGGVWIALMQFNVLPSVVLAVMLAIDKVSVGGMPLLVRALIWQVATCLLISALFGFAWRPESSMLEILAALPLLVVYPMAISHVAYRLARTVNRQNRRLAELTRIDQLTGLLNRVTWEDVAMRELRRHQRNGMQAALLMIDIDRFKAVNDEHGHPTGDEAIRGVAAIIRGCVREVDAPGRYGGDEFGVVLVHCDAKEAARTADRIRMRVLAGAHDRIPAAMLSVSIGIAVTSPDMNDIRAWIKQADSALLEAKARGRDCVLVAA